MVGILVQIYSIIVPVYFFMATAKREGLHLIAVFRHFNLNERSDCGDIASPRQNIQLHAFKINFDRHHLALNQRDEGNEVRSDAPGPFPQLPVTPY